MIERCLVCQEPITGTDVTLSVELNRDAEGNLHATQDHLNHAERVAGYAHLNCYKKWYEETYKSPFTMSGDGT